MKLFDLHCDTLSELYAKNEGMFSNTCHIDLNKASYLDSYTQVMAVWSKHDLSEDENYKECLNILDYAEKNVKNINGFNPILAVEGGKLLNNDISRLNVLCKRGVKIFTLVWKGISCIGGAYDNDEGLTDFGKQTVHSLFENNMIPDISHSNEKISYEALKIAKEYKRPIIASHSCSYSICSHRRNINDECAREVALGNGVIGVNFVSEHLGSKDMETILKHIDRLYNAAGREGVCLGGDFDGMSDEDLPYDIKNIGDLPRLYYAISKKYHSEGISEQIFYTNAQNFAKAFIF